MSKVEEVQEIKADVKELLWICGFTQCCQLRGFLQQNLMMDKCCIFRKRKYLLVRKKV